MEYLTANVANPEWTEYRKKNGLDPLGMQTSSVSLYQALMPGISNVTLRVRYYGLYAWLADTYAKRVGDTNPLQWQRFVRRAEALYALIARQSGQEGGVAGVTWAARTLDAASGTHIDFASDAEPGSPTHYLKQAWGAYGAAYATQLYAIGIFADTTAHGLPVPSAGIGDAIAHAFGIAAGALAERIFDAVQTAQVSRRSLEDMAGVLPSAIAAGGTERQLYESLLFAKAGLERESDRSRDRSLRLILNLVEHLGRIPTVQETRWELYTAVNAELDSQRQDQNELQAQRRRWWAYQANDLTHICYETLLKHVLDRLELYPDGVPLNQLLAELLDELRAVEPKLASSWAEFVAAHTPAAAGVEERFAKDLIRAGSTTGACTAEDVLTAIKLLAVVYDRAQSGREVVRAQFDDIDATAFHSVWTELRFLETHRDSPLDGLLANLIEQRVMRRHLWVAMRKLRYQGDYTFLIEVDNGLVRLRAKDGPVYTNPRLAPAIRFLQDIHLVDGQGLTSRGKQLMVNG